MMALGDMEALALWGAVVSYVLATVVALFGLVLGKKPERTVLIFMALALALHTVSLGLRWERIGHVPVSNLYEALSANVWGMMVAVTLAYGRLPGVRPAVAVMLPVIVLVLGWMMLVPAVDSSPPSTYDTVWLFIHIAFIKLFLGCALIALGMAGVILLRAAGRGRRFASMSDDRALEELSYRFMALGLIFDGIGILAGAIWAQDAWGRYWGWTELEVWSLITWLTIGLAIHLRATFAISPRIAAWMIVGVFVVAFLTFFGVPFVSTAVHKGLV